MEPSEPRPPVPPPDVDPVTLRRCPPSRAWYALTAIPLLIAAFVCARAIIEMVDRMTSMQRFVVPGMVELELDRGEQVVFGESRSVVNGVGYNNASFEVRCSVEDAATAKPLALKAPTGHTSYSLGGYQGESLWEVDVPQAGRYRMTCEGPDTKAVLAVGRGFGLGTAVLQMVLAGLLAMPLTALIGWRISRARSRANS
ncbi:MAG: hypothetical protein JWP01_3205 [Myxococcales bacterium]|nr:hypothetical protein [Myxococcales bacterium]